MVSSKQSAKATKPRDATHAASKKRSRAATKKPDGGKVAKPNAAKATGEKPARKRAKKTTPPVPANEVAAPEEAAADPLALVAAPKASQLWSSGDLEVDTVNQVGQYTRGKRYLEAIAQQELAKLVASGEITEDQADKIRLSKVWIQLMRSIAEKLMEDVYKQLALICRVTGRKTVDLQVLHTFRFMQSKTNAHLVKYTKQPTEEVYQSILSDFPELAAPETRTSEDYAALQRSMHVASSTFDELPVEEAICIIREAMEEGGVVTVNCPSDATDC